MPTENRSSNTELAVQHPQGRRERFQKWVLSTKHPVLGYLDGTWLARGDDREGYADKYVQGLWVAFKQFDQPSPQPHPEPIAWMVGTAIWWTKEEAERDAAVMGLPVVGLGPMTNRTAVELAESETMAAIAELAECEAMAAMVTDREWAEHVGTGDVSSKVEAAFTQLHNDLHEADDKLAERDALLRDLEGKTILSWPDKRRISAALSDSAEPSAPKCETCSDHGIVGNILNAEPCPDCSYSAPVERDERAEFEKWWSATMNVQEMDLHRHIYPMNRGWAYACHETNRSWMTWQARAALEHKPS